MQGIALKSNLLFPKAIQQKEDPETPQMEKQIAWGVQKTLYCCSIQWICLQMGKAPEKMYVKLSLWWSSQFINLGLGCILVEVMRGKHKQKLIVLGDKNTDNPLLQGVNNSCYCRGTVNLGWTHSLASKKQKDTFGRAFIMIVIIPLDMNSFLYRH